MIYATSDVHGCYRSFLALLERIAFSDEDLLCLVGGLVDYGPRSMTLLLDLCQRPNVLPLAGSHEQAAAIGLRFFSDRTERRATFGSLLEWLQDGGQATLEEFRQLDPDRQAQVLAYLEGFSSREEMRVGGRTYVLAPEVPEELPPDALLITGRLPEAAPDRITRRGDRVALDCGCGSGGQLGAWCLDTGEAFYVPNVDL